MGDDAHQVRFDDSALDRGCWGSGATGLGCGRRATSRLGLCDSCHAEILKRIEEGRATGRSAGGKGRVLEMEIELNCAGQVVSRTSPWEVHPIPGEQQEFE